MEHFSAYSIENPEYLLVNILSKTNYSVEIIRVDIDKEYKTYPNRQKLHFTR